MSATSETILHRLYGREMIRHIDLRRASNAHRGAHGPSCDVYPSDAAQAPLWPFLVGLVQGRRFLEIGCGLGYTAAVMASAGGPRARVDTIEADSTHADLAERAIARKGLASRVRVHRGRALEVLPRLHGPYDVVFLDGDWREYPRYLQHLVRLTRKGSVIVSANLSPLFGGWGIEVRGKGAIRTYLTRLIRDRRFRTYILQGEWHALTARVA